MEQRNRACCGDTCTVYEFFNVFGLIDLIYLPQYDIFGEQVSLIEGEYCKCLYAFEKLENVCACVFLFLVCLLFICLFVWLVCLLVYLFIWLFACLFVRMLIVSLFASLLLVVCLFICLLFGVFVCLSKLNILTSPMRNRNIGSPAMLTSLGLFSIIWYKWALRPQNLLVFVII